MTANTSPPEVGSAGSLPGASASGSFYTAGPQAGQPGQGVPGRGHEPSADSVRVAGPAPDFRAQALARSGVRPISLVPPNTTGIKGCTGNSEASTCTSCDRLRLAGPQLHPKATRVADGWACVDQVVDGVHACSVPRESGVDQHLAIGGEVVTTPANEWVPAA